MVDSITRGGGGGGGQYTLGYSVRVGGQYTQGGGGGGGGGNNTS